MQHRISQKGTKYTDMKTLYDKIWDSHVIVPETSKGLRCGDLMDQMQIAVENGRSVGFRNDDVRVPDFVV